MSWLGGAAGAGAEGCPQAGDEGVEAGGEPLVQAKWEREASVRLRDGDLAAVAAYDRHGRIRGADEQAAYDRAASMWLADYQRGKDVLLLAGSNAEAAELSRRVQAKLTQVGSVGPPQAPLSDSNRAGVSDLVHARLNTEIYAGGRQLTNRDTLTITAFRGPDTQVCRQRPHRLRGLAVRARALPPGAPAQAPRRPARRARHKRPHRPDHRRAHGPGPVHLQRAARPPPAARLPDLWHDVTWAQRTPASAPAVARELAAALDSRARALGERMAASPEPWLARQLGVLAPGASPALRAEYTRRAGTAAAYREAAGITNPDQAVSPMPHRNQPELETMRKAVLAALEIRDEADILRGLDRGELEARVFQGERARAAAPPDVSSRATAHRASRSRRPPAIRWRSWPA